MFSMPNTPMPSDKRRMLNTAIALSAVLLVIWVFMLQMKQPNTTSQDFAAADSTRDTRLDSLRLALGSDFPSAQRAEEDASATDGVLITFLLLASAVGGLWWFTRKQRHQHPTKQPGFMKEVARQEIQPGQELVVMEFNNEYWFMGSSAQGTQLMHRIPKTNIPITAFKPLEEEKSTVGFQQLMQQLRGGTKDA